MTKLPTHDISGYPVFYVNPASCTANCAECMQEDIDNEWVNPDEVTASVNWESEIHCDECSVQIESAYDSTAYLDSCTQDEFEAEQRFRSSDAYHRNF